MKTLKNTLESIIKSYNNNESVNFVDLSFLDINIKNKDLIEQLISNYNKKEALNFLLVQKLDNLINNK
jgi:hypothetical protein